MQHLMKHEVRGQRSLQAVQKWEGACIAESNPYSAE